MRTFSSSRRFAALGAGIAWLALAHGALAQEACSVAQDVQAGITFYDNTGATSDGPQPCGALGADLWYRFVAPAQGTVVVTTCDFTFMDTVLAAYTSCKSTALVCNDDTCGLQSRVAFSVTPNQACYIQLGGWNGEQGSGAFNVEFRADGACCLGGATCSLMSESACIAAGGVYRGDASSCATAQCADLGACCLPASQGLCRLMTPSECASAGGTYSGPGTSCTGSAPFDGAALLFSPAAQSTVTIQDAGAFAFTGGFTIEAWVRPTSTSGITRFITKGDAGIPGSLGYGLGQNNGRLRFTTYGITDYDTAAVHLSPGTWTHVAVILDQFATASFFVNGTFVESVFGNGPASQSPLPFQFGANAGGELEFFDGVVDEVRVWSIERSFSDIADTFDDHLTGAEKGLVGYWRLDEGAGAVAHDSSTSGFDGTINGAQWISTQTCSSATFGACCLPSGQCSTTTASGCLLAGGRFNGVGTSCGNANCPQPGACCLPVELGLCRVLLPDECAALGGTYDGPNTSCNNSGPFDGYALATAGGTDGVDNGNPAPLQLSSGFTLEAWIYPTSVTGIHRPMSKGQGGVAGYGFGTNGGRLRFTTFGIRDYDSAGTYIQANRWSHVAVVFTSSFNADFYVNGQFVETVTGSAPASPTNLSFFLGRNSAGILDSFVGRIDEVRVWNVQRSAAQIGGSFDQELGGNEPGLVGYWRLNEGDGTTATNAVSGIAGTLTGTAGWRATESCSGPTCPADWNNSGGVNSQDFFDFLTDFFKNHADFNHDSLTNSQDFFDFLAAFFTPC